MADWHLIGFAGAARSGKSTAAHYLAMEAGFHVASFAGALKEMTRALLTYRGVAPAMIEEMIEGVHKEEPATWLSGRSPRYFMQRLGTEFGRELVSSQLWIEAELDHLMTSGLRRAVFADVRFLNEVEAIRSRGGRVIRIIRPPSDNVRVLPHVSEQQPLATDITIINDGDLNKLFRSVRNAVGLDVPETV